MAGWPSCGPDEADAYARYRPRYPAELFRFLRRTTPPGAIAWDAGTGNGQAAEGLAAAGFGVVASDLNVAGLRSLRRDGIARAAMEAERPAVADRSIGLITVAQAFHWFEASAFFAAVDRVLCPGGVLAVWCYGAVTVSPSVDGILRHLSAETLRHDWGESRRLVEEGYASVAFPYVAVDAPAFRIAARWSVEDLYGYLQTWSAVRSCRRRTGTDPVAGVEGALRAAWGDGQVLVQWPLSLHVRRKP